MKRLLTTAAIVAGALYFGALQPADAGPSLGFLETYTITVDSGTGGPSITDNLAPFTYDTHGVATGPAALAIGALNTNLVANLATFVPNNGTSGGSQCVGTDCNTTTHTLTQRVTVDFTFTDNLGHTATLEQQGYFYAKYNSPTLACALNDPNSVPQSDCLIWDGTNASTHEYTGGHKVLLSAPTQIVDFGVDGAQLAVTFTNDIDWTLTPQVTFDVMALGVPSVPEPSTIALLGFGLLGTLAMARRKTR